MNYSPILEREVPVDILDVRFVKGFASNDDGSRTTADTYPAYGVDGNLIQLLATDEVSDLVDLIAKPGRYRIIARDPHTKRILAWTDELLRPRPGRRPLPEIDPAMLNPKARKGDDSRVEKLLEEQVKALRTANEALQTTVNTLQTEVRDRSIEAAEARTRGEGLQERVAELEAQRDEMRTKVAQLEATLENAEKQIADSQVSPLDALGGIRDGLGLIKDTVREFNDD